ncbi:MAG: hypothetical protein JW934_17325 [Anaerolineae bacterium]|nr:hypothetical protein [Anaerolineae bacterium]
MQGRTTSGRVNAVSRDEWVWVALWSAALLFVTSIPYLLGCAISTPEQRFSGFVYNIQDINTYINNIRQGMRGEWLYHIFYTTEPHQGALLFPFHLALGHLARQLNVTPEWIYHLARLACGGFVLAVAYRFVAAFTRRPAMRKLAFLLIAWSGGLGWLITLTGGGEWLGFFQPLDLILPEGFTFLSIYALPHLALAQALLLLFLLDAIKAIQTTRMVPTWRAGLIGLAITLLVPFYALVLWTIMWVYGIIVIIKQRRCAWRIISTMFIISVLPLPVVLYTVWLFTTDPIYAAWMAQNQAFSPHPLHYAAAYGPVALPALIGLIRTVKRRRGSWLFLLGWVCIVPVLVYLPFVSQRRFVVGVQVPLCILAAEGIIAIARRLKSSLRRGALTLTVVAMSLTPLLLIAGSSLLVLARPEPIFHAQDELDALYWLSQNTLPQESVLCTYDTGNYIPAQAGNRVFLGRGPETVRADEKRALVARFFDAQIGDEWRRSLLREYGIAYVLIGPRERALGAFDPASAPYLWLVYENESYVIYQFIQ